MRTRLLSALALAAGLAVAAPAGAQSPWGGWGQPRYGGYDVQRTAHDNGYRDGLSVGQRDARGGERYDVNRNRDYRDGDNGYDRRYGSRGDYRRYYRQGFEQGYREAYYGRGGRAVPRDPGYGRYPESSRYPDYGRYPNGGYGNGGYGGYGNGGYYSPAWDKGRADGYEKGLDDGRDGDRFDPIGEKWYRQGDRGYNSRYGSRDAYKNAYRQAFRQGYEQGYRDGQGGYGRYGSQYPNRSGGWRWPF